MQTNRVFKIKRTTRPVVGGPKYTPPKTYHYGGASIGPRDYEAAIKQLSELRTKLSSARKIKDKERLTLSIAGLEHLLDVYESASGKNKKVNPRK